MDAKTKEVLAKMAGNWKKFDSFGWYSRDEYEKPENWTIQYVDNRDSGLLEQSNAEYIRKAMKPFGDDVQPESHNHWAVGWVGALVIKVYGDDDEPTPAITKFLEIQERLDNYPVLDEDDFSKREMDACFENFKDAIRSFTSRLESFDDVEITDDLVSKVMKLNKWVEQNGYGQDNGGYYPGDDEIKEALRQIMPDKFGKEN